MIITTSYDTDDFAPWQGAITTLDNIKESGNEEYFWESVSQAFGGTIDETALNDLLWFEPELCYEWAEIETDEDGQPILCAPIADDNAADEYARIREVLRRN